MFVSRNSAIANKPRDAFVQMQWRRVADLKHASHAEFGRSALYCVDINIGEPPKWGALELRCLGMGNVANSKIHAFSSHTFVLPLQIR